MNPRSFKNINLANFNVIYKSNLNAWMTSNLFGKWLTNFNNSIRNENSERKVLLLLDNARCHTASEPRLSNVELKFLPPNATSKIQPLDAGIIAGFKSHYKKRYIKWILNNEMSNLDNKSTLSLIDAIRFIESSWNDITKDSILNSWNHTKIIKMESYNSIEHIENPIRSLEECLSNRFTGLTAEEYLNVENILDFEELNPVNNAIAENDVIYDFENSSSSSEDYTLADTITSSSALDACVMLQKFLQQQEEDYKKDIQLLEKIKKNIDTIINENKKTTLDKFCNK